MNNKLREALENSNGLLEELALVGEWYESAKGQITENKAALAEPLRNCDVGTKEEQTRRFEEFCDSQTYDDYFSMCSKCVLKNEPNCTLAWAQMTYEETKE